VSESERKKGKEGKTASSSLGAHDYHVVGRERGKEREREGSRGKGKGKRKGGGQGGNGKRGMQ
jgi:hypothetical protein